MLKGIYTEEMPYRDPHTAAPGLWALRHSTQTAFEVAFCPVEADTPRRRGLEAVAIAIHRQCHGRSPTLNFGRMPAAPDVVGKKRAPRRCRQAVSWRPDRRRDRPISLARDRPTRPVNQRRPRTQLGRPHLVTMGFGSPQPGWVSCQRPPGSTASQETCSASLWSERASWPRCFGHTLHSSRPVRLKAWFSPGTHPLSSRTSSTLSGCATSA